MAKRLATATVLIYSLNLVVGLLMGVAPLRAVQLAALDVCVLTPLVVLFVVLRHQLEKSALTPALINSHTGRVEPSYYTDSDDE